MVHRSPDQPKALGKALIVHDYATLRTKLTKLSIYKTVVVSGPHGRGKTELAKEILGKGAYWFGSRSTAFFVYKTIVDLTEDPGLVVGFDDVLLKDPQLIGILMEVLDTGPTRTVSWNTSAALQHGLPARVRVPNPVLILTNDLTTFQKTVPLDDRPHHIHFMPPALAVHERAATFFCDQDIFDYIADQIRLGVVGDCSLRMYTKALKAKQAGDDWRQEIIPYLVEERLRIAAEIDAQYHTPEEKVAAYFARTGNSRATFYRDLKALRGLVQPTEVPRIILHTQQKKPQDRAKNNDNGWIQNLRQPPLN